MTDPADVVTLSKAIPFTAWEQAVFVVLIIIMVVIFLVFIARESKLNRTFQKTESEARDKSQRERDAEWRNFMQAQRALDQQITTGVQASLDGLTKVIATLVIEVQDGRAEFQVHDQKEWAKLDEMSRKLNRRRGKETSNEAG